MKVARIDKIRSSLNKKDIDAFIITDIFNIRYLSGFSGSNCLCLITGENQFLFTDSRYKEQIGKETTGFKTFVSKGSLFEELFNRRLLTGIKQVGFESENLSYSSVTKLKKLFPGIKFMALSGIIENCSMIKEANEINYIRTAVDITDLSFTNILKFLSEDVSELDLSAEISYSMRKLGSERDAFDPIVAGGISSSMPHAKPCTKKIKKGYPVLFDFGAVYKGYNSDMTRTIFYGKPDNSFCEIYHIVHDAQRMAIEGIREGITCKELDGIARKYIYKKGYGKYFGHALGHGLGLRPHNLPIVSYKSNEILKTNMVVTIEPGIYIPGKFGIRIEDDILVKENGFEILNKSEKELLEI